MATYSEGGINYENKNGKIYKNGVLVPESNYKYIPSAIGGSRVDTNTKSSSNPTSMSDAERDARIREMSLSLAGGSANTQNSIPKRSTTQKQTTTGGFGMDELNAMLGQYTSQYQDQISQIQNMLNQNQYARPSDSELQSQASTFANLQIDPMLQALRDSLQQAEQTANTRKGEVEAAYTGYQDAANKMLDERAKQALESAIARGGGRSGAVEWLTAQQQEPILQQTAQAEAEKASTLSSIAEALALAKQQGSQKEQDLAARRGELESNQLANLQSMADAAESGNWQQMINNMQTVAGLTGNLQNMGLDVFSTLAPYLTMTEFERQQQPIDWTQATGQTPNLGSTTTSPVPLRSYASQQGASIGYDPATKSVTINGKKYSQNQLQGLGGYLQDGAWYIPQSALAGIL